LHCNGLLLSVQESGVVELWAERGAPKQNSGHDFAESSVCLTRLDLGEESPGAPFFWNHNIYIPGRSSLSTFEMSSSPSLGTRIDLSEIGCPLYFAAGSDRLFVWGEKGLGEISQSGGLNLVDDAGAPSRNGFLVSDGKQRCLRVHGTPPRVELVNGEKTEPTEALHWTEPVEYALYADRFLLFAGKKMAFFEDDDLQQAELPATVIAQPIYSPAEDRLTLLLNDGSIRTCSTRGEKFSYHCDLAGPPSTWPLKLGAKVFYGTEGRYLCCDEEAIRPRLGSPPMGALTFANGRVFGTLRDGSLYCFEL
jgi:hypothetical protein